MKIDRHTTSFILALVCFVLLLLTSCKAKVIHVPIETIKTEYRERLERDSIYLHDSIFVERWKSNDTVFMTKEKYKYLYRDKLIHDTICKIDSIAVPYPVIEVKEVNNLHTWQIVLMCLGVLLIGYLGFKIIRNKVI